jgi:hypothetical protein
MHTDLHKIANPAASLAGAQALTRCQDWPTVLARYVHDRLHTPFAWGHQDCCRFAADAVAAMTGTDPMSDLRHVRTAEAATRLLATYPLTTLASARLGPMRPAAVAQRGDVVLLCHNGRQLLGLCVGVDWVAPAAHGLTFGPMHTALGAWPVGRDLGADQTGEGV